MSRLFRALLLVLVIALLILGAPGFALAQKQWVESSSTRRIALVIGNGSYTFGPKLKNPANDAKAVGKVLKSLGFTVILLTDGTKRQMLDAIDAFGEKMTSDCVALCYYSGHGAQIDGVNYLLPVDFRGKSRADAEDEAIAARRILGRFDEKHSPVNLLILDACRNNPFRSFARSGEGGLGRMDAPRGTLIAYATAPGSVADDNSEGQNGLYTTALLKALPRPGIKVQEVFEQVLDEVATASKEQQTPWIESSLRGNLYLAGRKSKASGKIVPAKGGEAPPPVVTLAKTKTNPKDGAEMILIPAGEFAMGDDDFRDTEGRATNPRHTVRLSAYYIYKNLVTVEMYEKFCKETNRDMPPAPDFDPNWTQKNHPIVNVIWEDARAYCEWAGVRLPTEAQWEKAARWNAKTGIANKYPWGEDFDQSKLWCSKSRLGDAGGTAPVGSYPAGASPYSVLDMAGNTWQWCEDWYDETFWTNDHASQPDPVNESIGAKQSRVVRSGAWGGVAPIFFRSAYRDGFSPTFRDRGNSFRACMVP